MWDTFNRVLLELKLEVPAVGGWLSKAPSVFCKKANQGPPSLGYTGTLAGHCMQLPTETELALAEHQGWLSTRAYTLQTL
ncbi:unnamed protein product [Sphagnum jensenii]|uniref:Uncharacterized protein n=1 Tax=Sphagnum jensenii TaxID=128206 RepID=A0ABP1A7Y0_9BRYO